MQEWYSIQMFAKLVGVHPNTIRNGIRNGKIHAVDHGTRNRKYWRIHYKEVERMGVFSLREWREKI
jgi:excisionase family DNA binding protein